MSGDIGETGGGVKFRVVLAERPPRSPPWPDLIRPSRLAMFDPSGMFYIEFSAINLSRSNRMNHARKSTRFTNGRSNELLARRWIEDQGFVVHDANIVFGMNCPNIDLIVYNQDRKSVV